MINILKMDIRRVLYSKTFYVSLCIMTIMAFAVVYSGMTQNLEGILGIIGANSAGDDFMTTMMGTGLLNILLSILLSIVICGDYTSGMAKNIFAVHANKWEYILGKITSMALVSAMFIIVYILEAVLALLIFGNGITFTGGMVGLFTFFVEKWISSCAFISIITLICCFTRHSAWGILTGFLVATGGLTMGLYILANLLPIPVSVISTFISFTVSGSSQLATLSFSAMTFIKIVGVSIIWLIVTAMISHKVLLKKDI